MPCRRTLACRARRVLHTAVMEQAGRPSPPVEFMAMSPLISGLASVASLLSNASSSGRANAPRRSGGDTAPDQASAVVTLSPQAEALAGFAAKGILVSQGRVDGAASAGAGGTLQGRDARAAGSVSTHDFQELLARFGADDAQKAELAAGFDTDKDGRISHAEFLQGLAGTAAPAGGTGFSQAVRQLMDRGGDGNGVVSSKEFAALATAFAQAEQRSGTA